MTLARKKRLHGLAEGLCAWCRKPVEVSGPTVVYDHRICLTLGGSDEDDNIRPLHAIPCDKQKTALDKRIIAKVERQRRKALGIVSRKRKRIWRGFKPWPKGRKLRGRPFQSKADLNAVPRTSVSEGINNAQPQRS